MDRPEFVRLEDYREYPREEMQQRSASFFAEMKRRRSVREFSDREIPDGIIEDCLRTAGSAPSGANLQPWHFVVVRDGPTKSKIRAAAEEEEREFYERRAPQPWLDALHPIGTDAHKPFLEVAPVLIAIFARYFIDRDGTRQKTYYPSESVGLASGLLIAALHHAGLASLTHTPSPMGFLNDVLQRPDSERPFLLLVVGYPAADVQVPNIGRKDLSEFASFL